MSDKNFFEKFLEENFPDKVRAVDVRHVKGTIVSRSVPGSTHLKTQGLLAGDILTNFEFDQDTTHGPVNGFDPLGHNNYSYKGTSNWCVEWPPRVPFPFLIPPEDPIAGWKVGDLAVHRYNYGPKLISGDDVGLINFMTGDYAEIFTYGLTSKGKGLLSGVLKVWGVFNMKTGTGVGQYEGYISM
jgi:hypothetical protein